MARGLSREKKVSGIFTRETEFLEDAMNSLHGRTGASGIRFSTAGLLGRDGEGNGREGGDSHGLA